MTQSHNISFIKDLVAIITIKIMLTRMSTGCSIYFCFAWMSAIIGICSAARTNSINKSMVNLCYGVCICFTTIFTCVLDSSFGSTCRRIFYSTATVWSMIACAIHAPCSTSFRPRTSRNCITVLCAIIGKVAGLIPQLTITSPTISCRGRIHTAED